MSELSITLYNPHPKQLEVHNDKHRFKVLNWGRRCFGENTLILMSDGTKKPIKSILPGDKVLSYDLGTYELVSKKILAKHLFGVDLEPKPMLQLKVHGKTITTTYDHEFFIDSQWIPAYKFAWGSLETSQREKLKLLCKQYGQTFDDKLEESRQDTSNEASIGRFWVLKNSDRQENNKGASGSSSDVDTQSLQQTSGESLRQRQNKQRREEFRVGDTKGKRSSRSSSGKAEQESGGEVRNSRTQGQGRVSDTSLPESQQSPIQPEAIGDNPRELSPGKTRLNPRRIKRKDLEAFVVDIQETYDLEVEDTHNYIAEDFLVHNTGKSTLAANYVLLQASQIVGRYWIVAPTYKQAKNIYWLDIINNQIPKELIKKRNEQELIVTLINGSIIELKGADNEDSLRGAGIKGLVLDEYAFMKPNVWELILRPMLADSLGWAIFISTPNGFNHFYDISADAQTEEKKDWWYSHATTYNNPHIQDSEINEIKADTTEDQFAQEYMAEFRKMAGLVYKDFNRDTHVVAGSDMPDLDNCTHSIGIDFGFTNPTAAVFVAVDYDQNWWIYDEVYKAGMTTEQTHKVLTTKMARRFFTNKIGDSAASQEIANLNASPFSMGIEPVRKTKDSISSGIRLINDALKIQEGTGKPKLFIAEHCKNLIYEFETYHYPDQKMNRNAPEDPVKENDHALDALRYLKLKLYYGNPNLKAYKPKKMLDRKYKR